MRSADMGLGEILMDRLRDCLMEMESLGPDVQAVALLSVLEGYADETSTFKIALALKSACLILDQDF